LNWDALNGRIILKWIAKKYDVIMWTFELGRPKGRDLCIDDRIILKWIAKKYGVITWTSFIRRKVGTSGGYCDLSLMKGDCYIFSQDSSPWNQLIHAGLSYRLPAAEVLKTDEA
jgi:hypothetical protein